MTFAIHRIKDLAVVFIGALSLFYIVNPTFGVFEFIPDNLPIVGNLDEAAAVALLISCLKYFGVDFSNIFRRRVPVKDDGSSENIW